jgi:hypothetical protein
MHPKTAEILTEKNEQNLGVLKNVNDMEKSK